MRVRILRRPVDPGDRGETSPLATQPYTCAARPQITSQVGRTDYVRVAFEGGDVVPLATSGASILSSTVRAAGCVIVPRELEGMPAGSEVEVLLYDEPDGQRR